MELLFDGFEASARLLGLVLLHFLWQGALIGAVFALLRNSLNAGRQRYALGLFAFGALALSPVLTALWLASGSEDLAATATAAVTAVASAATPAGSAEVGSIIAWQDLLPWIVALWGLGVMVLTARALLHWRGLSLLIRRGNEMPAWETELLSLCERFGVSRAVRLLYSADVQTPTLVGWIKPVILLPAAVALGFPAAQIELILAHELGHLRRWDHVINLLQVVIETVLFYHPVVHWISRDLRNQREICCDELVLKLSRANPRDYVETLADLEQLRLYGHGELGMAATGGVLLERVQHIAKIPPTTLGLRVPGRVLPLLVVGLAVLWMGVAQRAEWDRAVFASIFSPQQLRTLFESNVIATSRPAIAIGDLLSDRRKLGLPQISVPKVEAPVDAAPVAAAPVALESVPAPTAAAPDAGPLNLALASSAPLPIGLGTAAARDVAIATKSADVAQPAVAPPVEAAPTQLLTTNVAAVEPVPVHVSQPAYPTSALLRGVEGQVKLSFLLDAGGQVRDVKIERSTPDGVFDGESIAALRKWRFDPSTYSVSGTRFTRSFVFSLGKHPATADLGVEELPAANDCRVITGTRICRRRDGAEEPLQTASAPN